MNDCKNCDHSFDPQGGHCYMFKEEPPFKCAQFTDQAMLRSLSVPSVVSAPDISTFGGDVLTTVLDVSAGFVSSVGAGICKVGEAAGDCVCGIGSVAGEVLSSALD